MPLAPCQTVIAKSLHGLEEPLPLCVPPGPPFTVVEELGTASGLAAGALSCEREGPLSPRRSLEDAMVSWHQWCGTSGRAAPLLPPPVWSTAPCMAACQPAQAARAASPWQVACGS